MMTNLQPALTLPRHGGNLEQACKEYGGTLENWLDMSTGISPWHYPTPEIPSSVWQQLPSNSQRLIEAASQFYQAPVHEIAPGAGSQPLIRLIPQFIESSTVALPSLGYQEHAYAWQLAGHQPVFYRNTTELLALVENNNVDHAVLINPNNPTGEITPPNTIKSLACNINGHLIIDEAFFECIESQHPNSLSAISHSHPNITVLRSLGKFFGLAGLRVGFAIGRNELVTQLRRFTQPWPISSAGELIAISALQDSAWHTKQRARIRTHSLVFEHLVSKLAANVGITHTTHTGLFHTLFGAPDNINWLHHALAKQNIWTRRNNSTDPQAWLRLSLPADTDQFIERTQDLAINGH